MRFATFLYNYRPFEVEGGGNCRSPQETFRGRPANRGFEADLDAEEALRISDVATPELREALSNRKEVMLESEEIWKRLRANSAREIAMRRKGEIDYQVGDCVFI